jgi:hypothetical protein
MRHIARLFTFLKTYNFVVMSKIKLNKIGNFQLTNNEKQELKGAASGGHTCGCGCCYEGKPGGSTVSANCSANYKTGLYSTDCQIVCWGISVD